MAWLGTESQIGPRGATGGCPPDFKYGGRPRDPRSRLKGRFGRIENGKKYTEPKARDFFPISYLVPWMAMRPRM
jgi:hypothetical protein